MKVIYKGDEFASQEVVNWGGNDNPKGLLVKGQRYEVLEKDIRVWHTKLTLENFPDKRFNSVSFDSFE